MGAFTNPQTPIVPMAGLLIAFRQRMPLSSGTLGAGPAWDEFSAGSTQLWHHSLGRWAAIGRIFVTSNGLQSILSLS